MCIKTLPSTLVIQLKRFYYDWDAGRSLKFDDYFQVGLTNVSFAIYLLTKHLFPAVSLGIRYGTLHL